MVQVLKKINPEHSSYNTELSRKCQIILISTEPYTIIMKIKPILQFILIQGIILLSLSTFAASNEASFDLAFKSLETAPSGGPGNPLYASFIVENTGTQISMSSKVTVYLSIDPNISTSDISIGETEISFIRPSLSTEKGLICTIPGNTPPGTYYAGAILSSKYTLVKDEHEEDNIIISNNVTISRGYGRSQEWYNEQISDRVLNFTNEERVKRKLPELVRDLDLDAIALNMSRDMANRQFFDHINPSGQNPIDRAKEYGFDQYKKLPDGTDFYGIGENIVKIPIGTVFRYGMINPDDPEQIASVAIRSFMDSPPHKSTLLFFDYEKIGIGTAFDGKDYYITQNFF